MRAQFDFAMAISSTLRRSIPQALTGECNKSVNWRLQTPCIDRRAMSKATSAPAARAEALRVQLDDANHRYHVLDEPAITDAEYDG